MATTRTDILELLYDMSRYGDIIHLGTAFPADLGDHRPLRDHVLEALAGEISPDPMGPEEEDMYHSPVGEATILGDVMLDYACTRVGHDGSTPCPKCDGSGWVVTGAGAALLQFLKRHHRAGSVR